MLIEDVRKNRTLILSKNIISNHFKASSSVYSKPAKKVFDYSNISQQDIVYNIPNGAIDSETPYANDLFQIYHIITKHPLAIKLTRFSLEHGPQGTCNDYLIIGYNGYTSDKLCGNRGKVREWTSGWKLIDSTRVMLTFVTDYSITKNGFRFEWKSQNSLISPIVLKHNTIGNECTMTSMIRQFNQHILTANAQELVQIPKYTCTLLVLIIELSEPMQIYTRSERQKSARLNRMLNRMFRQIKSAKYFQRNPPARSRSIGCNPGQVISCKHLQFTTSPSYSALVGRLALIFYEKLSSCPNERLGVLQSFNTSRFRMADNVNNCQTMLSNTLRQTISSTSD